MKLDAPQLSNVTPAIADDGRTCQFNLANAEGATFNFRLSFRQLGYLANAVEVAAKEMRSRLQQNKEAAEAEMLAGLSAPHTVTAAVVAESDLADIRLWIETEKGGGLSLQLSIPKATDLMNGLQAALAPAKKH